MITQGNDSTVAGHARRFKRLRSFLTGSPRPSYISVLYEFARFSSERIFRAHQRLYGSPCGCAGAQGSSAGRGEFKDLAPLVAILDAHAVSDSAERVHTHPVRAQEFVAEEYIASGSQHLPVLRESVCAA